MKDKDLLSSREEALKLYDAYKPLLSDEAVDRFEEYYCDDLSLSEIAESRGVSRSAVYDGLHKTLKKMLDYEKKLGLVSKREKIDKLVESCQNEKGEKREEALKKLWEVLKDAI